MGQSVNKVILIGTVGADPEIRQTQGGKSIASIRLVTSESWKDKTTGEKKDRSEWHRIVVFNDGLASVVEKYVKKGSKLYIEGQLATRKWTDKDGQERTSTEVVLQSFNGTLVMVGDTPSGRAPQKSGDYERAKSGSSAPKEYKRSIDEDLPF